MFCETLLDIETELGPSRTLAMAMRERELRAKRKSFRGPDGLLNFIKHFWHVLEPVEPFLHGWALRAMCDHLQAVTDGHITRLLINVPPGSMKSLLVNVFWPAWEWSAGNRPDLRYISFSYASHLTERDNQKFLDLLSCPEFKELYPKLELRDKGKVKVSNRRTGWKFATSVGGVGTGERGDRVMLDDPHNVKESESDVVRTETVRWFKEAMSNRLNNMTRSVIVVIMQRVHENDVSGEILAAKLGYVHLCIPMEFEPATRCKTHLQKPHIPGLVFWQDPRRYEGECFWPERFDPASVVMCKLLGEHTFAGQYQQRPEPRGGGLFKRSYWRRWEMEPAAPKFPKAHYIVASLDGAFTEKKQNDPSGFTCWAAFTDKEGNACAITMTAWRKHLKLNGTVRPRKKGELMAVYKMETEQDWGLIQWLAYECTRWGGVDKLLIENKANGHDVVSEMIRQFAWAKTLLEMVDPGQNDKWARAMRVQGVFAEGLIYTLDERLNRQWVNTLIGDMAIFPRGQFDDLVDSTTQALWWLRRNGFLVMAEERKQMLIQRETFKRRLQPLYGV